MKTNGVRKSTSQKSAGTQNSSSLKISSYRFVMISSQMFMGSILASGYLLVQVLRSLLREACEAKLPRNQFKNTLKASRSKQHEKGLNPNTM